MEDPSKLTMMSQTIETLLRRIDFFCSANDYEAKTQDCKLPTAARSQQTRMEHNRWDSTQTGRRRACSLPHSLAGRLQVIGERAHSGGFCRLGSTFDARRPLICSLHFEAINVYL